MDLLIQLDAWGSDGEIIQLAMPSETDVSNLVSESEEKYRNRLGKPALPLVQLHFFVIFCSLLLHNSYLELRQKWICHQMKWNCAKFNCYSSLFPR